MSLTNFVNRVDDITKQDLASGETMDQMFFHTAEELGEYAAAVTIEKGVKNKPLAESSKSEAVDLTICALSLFFGQGGTLEELVEIGEKKLDKWKVRIKPSIPNRKELMVHVTQNRDEIEASKKCVCLYCDRVFDPTLIRRWVDSTKRSDQKGTAICPFCGVDAILGDKSGLPVEDSKFIKAINFWD